jgi:hypothetical protein
MKSEETWQHVHGERSQMADTLATHLSGVMSPLWWAKVTRDIRGSDVSWTTMYGAGDASEVASGFANLGLPGALHRGRTVAASSVELVVCRTAVIR